VAGYEFAISTNTHSISETVQKKRGYTMDTGKYDRELKTILHDERHWLNVHERIEYKLGVMVSA